MRLKAVFPPLNEPGRPGELLEFEWEAPDTSKWGCDAIEVALDLAFREFNIVEAGDHHAARECRSMSVGDAIVVDGRIHVCDMAGWIEVDEAFFTKWLKVPFSRRLLGSMAFKEAK